MGGIELLGELGPYDRSHELNAFQRLTAEQRAIVLKRLTALHSYAELAVPTYQDAERLAHTIEMRRTNFMRLLARVKRYGAVDGLVPNRQPAKRYSKTNRGYAEEVEKAFAAALAEDPIATLGQIRKAMLTTLPEKDVPHASSLRRRLSEVRQAGAGGEAAAGLIRSDPVFGRQIFVGSAITDVVVDVGEGGDEDRLRACHLALIVDVDTRLVIGAGLAVDLADAAAGAAYDVDLFNQTMTIGSVRLVFEDPNLPIVAITMEKSTLTDAAPSNTEPSSEASGSLPDVSVELSSHLLFRIVGGRLGRVVLSPDYRERGTGRAPFSIMDAKEFVRGEVDRWNYLMLCAHDGMRPDAGTPLVEKRMRHWRRRVKPVVDGFTFLMHGINGTEGAKRAAVHGE